LPLPLGAFGLMTFICACHCSRAQLGVQQHLSTQPQQICLHGNTNCANIFCSEVKNAPPLNVLGT
jgi:hypothetical protein